MHEDDEPIQGDGMTAEHRLDAALRAALRPEEPSEGFAGRVEERLRAQSASTPPANSATVEVAASSAFSQPAVRQPKVSVMRAGNGRLRGELARAAVLLLAVILPLGWRLHHQGEMARGEAARQQVMLALRITGSQLRSIQERTQAINAGGMPEGETR